MANPRDSLRPPFHIPLVRESRALTREHSHPGTTAADTPAWPLPAGRRSSLGLGKRILYLAGISREASWSRTGAPLQGPEEPIDVRPRQPSRRQRRDERL